MIDQDDVSKLLALQNKSVKELNHNEVLFLLYIFPLLSNDAIIAPNCDPVLLRELSSTLAPLVENILNILDLDLIEELLNQMNQSKNTQSSSSAEEQLSQVSIPSENIRDEYLKALSIVCKEKSISSMEKLSIKDLIERKFIPFEYIFLISRMPEKCIMKSSTIMQYTNRKSAQLMSIIDKKIDLQREALINIESDVLGELSKAYPLSLIAEAEYYSTCQRRLWKQYGTPNKRVYFQDDDHKRQVAKRLHDLMHIAKISPSALAKRVGISRQTISSLLQPNNSKTFVETNTFEALSSALCCAPEYLLCQSDYVGSFNPNSATPLIKVIYPLPSNKDYHTMAKRTGKLSTHVIEKIVDAENLLLPEDFSSIEKHIDELVNQRKKGKSLRNSN